MIMRLLFFYMSKTAIFLFGSQGSGKSTQGKFLVKELGYFDWNMGSMLREEVASGSKLGLEVGSLINRGFLLSDEDLFAVIDSRLDAINDEIGVVFDGVPRRPNQADRLIAMLREKGFDKFVTVFINVPRIIALERLIKRAGIEHRVDDTEETINFRLKQFMEETWPTIEFLRKETMVLEIDGVPSVEEVHEQIQKGLSGL